MGFAALYPSYALHVAVSNLLARAPFKAGGILDALRRSPLVGANLDLSRSRRRKVEL